MMRQMSETLRQSANQSFEPGHLHTITGMGTLCEAVKSVSDPPLSERMCLMSSRP